MKKKILIGMIFVTLLVLLGSMMTGCACGKSEEEEFLEPEKLSEIFGKYIEPPEAKGRLALVVDEVERVDLGVGTIGISVTGVVKNVSNDVVRGMLGTSGEEFLVRVNFKDTSGAEIYGEVKIEEVTFGKYHPTGDIRGCYRISSLKPGQEETFTISDFGPYLAGVKKYEITIIGLSTQPSISPTISAEERKGAAFTVTDYPKNPRTPAEVVITFYWLIYEEKYSQAKELLTSEYLDYLASKPQTIEWLWEHVIKAELKYSGTKVIRILDKDVSVVGNRAEIKYVELCYAGGEVSHRRGGCLLIKIDGKWKING